MNGTVALKQLLREMDPALLPGEFVYCCLPGMALDTLGDWPLLATVAEPEGLTVVLERAFAENRDLACQGPFRALRLQVHSSLQATGLTAAVSTELASFGIAANVLAGYHHDVLMVPAADAIKALRALRTLSRQA